MLSLALFFSCKKDSQSSETNLDYFPLTTGSEWTYGGTISSYYKVTGSTATKFGRTYKEFYSTNASSSTPYSSYYAHENGIYYYVFKGSLTQESEYIILKDNVNIGDSWDNNVAAGSGINKYQVKVVEKGISLTVNGIQFNNVIHTETTLSGTVTNNYYAPGVGQIKITQGSTTVKELLSYTIK